MPSTKGIQGISAEPTLSYGGIGKLRLQVGLLHEDLGLVDC